MVFPALGTGTLNYPTKSVASEMLMSVERFVKQCPSTTLREITFVIHPKDVDVFKVNILEIKKKQRFVALCLMLFQPL